MLAVSIETFKVSMINVSNQIEVRTIIFIFDIKKRSITNGRYAGLWYNYCFNSITRIERFIITVFKLNAMSLVEGLRTNINHSLVYFLANAQITFYVGCTL
jgi:hypothetical protein